MKSLKTVLLTLSNPGVDYAWSILRPESTNLLPHPLTYPYPPLPHLANHVNSAFTVYRSITRSAQPPSQGLSHSTQDGRKGELGTRLTISQVADAWMFDLSRAVFNYITWNIIYEYGSYLSQDFHDAYMDFSHDVYGIKKSSPLWRRCVRGTDTSLDMGVSMLFINGSGFTNESRQHVCITRRTRRILISNVRENLTWQKPIIHEWRIQYVVWELIGN